MARFLVFLVLALAAVGTRAEAPRLNLTCYCDVFPPYVIDRAGELAGIDVDTVAEAGRRAGIAISFRRLPWERLKQEMARGRDSEVTCAFAFTRTPEREPLMRFGTVPLHMTSYALFVPEQDRGTRSLPDLIGKAIGVRRGFRLPAALESGVREKLFRIEEVDTDEVNFRKLQAGRIAAVLTNPEVGQYVLRTLDLRGVRALDDTLMSTPTYLVFVKDKPTAGVLGKLDQALRTMQNDGSWRTIRAKYVAE